MADKDVARALNILGADRDLINSDSSELLDLINDYWADDEPDDLNAGMVTAPTRPLKFYFFSLI